MVRLETRLRELGRGAREDLPKILSEMQAFSERERLGNMDPIPLFETPQDGWKRVADWLDEVMEDAVQECLDDEDASNSSDKVLDVLVISHSGLLRLFLERLVGVPRLQEHPEGRFEEKNGVLVFSIPNSSVTILNIDLSKLKEPSEEKHSSWTVSDAVQVRIEQLTNTEHYSRMQESTAVAEAPQQWQSNWSKNQTVDLDKKTLSF